MFGHTLRTASMCLTAATLLIACNGDGEGDPGGTGGAGGTGGTGGTGGGGLVTWTPCPILTEGEGTGADCAEVKLALDWSKASEPGVKTIPLFVKRIPGTAEKRDALWILPGGPGSSGASVEKEAAALAQALGTFDIYLPDQRGVGRSARLSCPVEEADGVIEETEWPACIDALKATWGEDLAHFNLTNAGEDLGLLIAAMRERPDQKVHVLAVSAGTAWAQRYLALGFSPPATVTLDGLSSPDLSSPFDFDKHYDAVGKDLLAACGADPFCAGKMGPDPVATVEATFAGLDQGDCSDLTAIGFDRSVARRVFALLLSFGQFRDVIPAFAYRMNRCEPGDVQAIGHLMTKFLAGSGGMPGGSPDPEAKLASEPFKMHILLSENAGPTVPSMDDIKAVQDEALFATEAVLPLRALWDIWPRYERDEYFGKYLSTLSTELPMLMLNGTLDPSTPHEVAQQIAAHYTAPGQKLVTIPLASHVTLTSSPLASDPAQNCGSLLFAEFLQKGGHPLDESCTGKVKPLDFQGNAQTAQLFFGKGDLWENVMP
jgi:pimeloyl-ACP methyl ester carboxylesterase